MPEQTPVKNHAVAEAEMLGLGSLDEQFENLEFVAEHAELRLQRFALVVDATGSMQGHWDVAREALKEAVDSIKSRSTVPVQICVVGYRDHVCDPSEDVVEASAWSSDTDLLKDYISSIRCRGGGDYPESVGHGLASLQQTKVNQIILIGDAPGREGSQGYREAQASGATGCPIYALYCHEERDLVSNFKTIAKLSGGKAFHLTRKEDLADIFQVLLASNKALQVTYQPTTEEGLRLKKEMGL
jgi:hypothetical protein